MRRHLNRRMCRGEDPSGIETEEAEEEDEEEDEKEDEKEEDDDEDDDEDELVLKVLYR